MYRNTFSGLLPGSWSKRRRGKSSKSGKKLRRKKAEDLPAKILVAGVNGKLGPHVIRHLLASNFAVTAFTTDPVKSVETYPGIQMIPADYTNLQAQIPLLRGFDALVILLSRTQDNIQKSLIDAAIEAEIPHIIPSSFNLDNRNPTIRENPIYAPKIAMENYLLARANEGRVTFTAIQTGVFLEWGMSVGTPINLSGTAPTLLFDGGTIPFSITSHDDIGLAVANALLLRSDPRVRNQILRIHSTIATQNQLLQLAAEVRPDVEWKTIDVDTESAYVSSFEAWERGERDPAVLRGLMPRMVYGLGLGVFEEDDNGVLGVERWTVERLKGAIEEGIERVMMGRREGTEGFGLRMNE